MLEHLVYDKVGLIHLLASMAALISGTVQLIMAKGTMVHKRVGFIYTASMSILLITAFMIYRLFGGFGIFHVAAIISSVTLAGGMVPVLFRKPDNWLTLHFAFMYWSVMGLYMAFAAEVLTRVPETPFLGMVSLATGGIGLFAGIYFHLHKAQWAAELELNT